MFSQHQIGFGASFGAASNWPEAPLRACQNETENTVLRSFTIDTHVCEVTQDSLVPITALINPISQHTITIAFVVVAAIVV